MSIEEDKEMKELLDDDKIREFFMSRDPSRPKPSPFLTDDEERSYTGKASKLTLVEEEKEEKTYGVSYSEHQHHSKQVAFRFFNLGLILGLLLSIVLVLIFG